MRRKEEKEGGEKTMNKEREKEKKGRKESQKRIRIPKAKQARFN